MTDARFRTLCADAYKRFVKLVPNPKTRYKKGGSTGNMALNATKITFPSPYVCMIYIDERISPYLPYTDKPWLAKRWKGKKNPNEGWFERAAEFMAAYVAKKAQGELQQNDSYKRTD